MICAFLKGLGLARISAIIQFFCLFSGGKFTQIHQMKADPLLMTEFGWCMTSDWFIWFLRLACFGKAAHEYYGRPTYDGNAVNMQEIINTDI